MIGGDHPYRLAHRGAGCGFFIGVVSAIRGIADGPYFLGFSTAFSDTFSTTSWVQVTSFDSTCSQQILRTITVPY
jgi:hypothetical protein